MWWPAIVRAVVAGAAYAVGALRDLYPDEPRFKIGLSVAVGLAVLGAVFWVEYRQTVRPALHVARARGAIMRQLVSSSRGVTMATLRRGINDPRVARLVGVLAQEGLVEVSSGSVRLPTR